MPTEAESTIAALRGRPSRGGTTLGIAGRVYDLSILIDVVIVRSQLLLVCLLLVVPRLVANSQWRV